MHIAGALGSLILVASAAAYTWDPLPDANSNIVRKHVLERSSMMQTEGKYRRDHEFRQNLSPVAKQAAEIVQRIRQDEIENFWPKTFLPGSDNKGFAGEMFSLARDQIPKTKLWKIVKRMPKGALLHAHLTVMLPFETLLEIALQNNGMAISSSQNLATQEARQSAVLRFSHHNSSIPAEPSIYSNEYVPGTPISLQFAAKGFPEGGESGFRKFFKAKMAIPPEESTHHELGVDQIWERFGTSFVPARDIVTYEPVIRTFYQRLFEQLVDDGISWVEIRGGGPSPIIHEGQQDVDPSLDIWWEIMEDEIAKFQSTAKGKHFWGARVIWADFRSLSQAPLVDAMKVALGRKVKFPKLISGYDVVGQEDLGRSLLDLAPELLWFQEQAARLNVTIPFFLHAGETLGDGNSTDQNLFDALLLGSRRIGHAFSLYKHPWLIQEVINNKVMVEVCPISNEVLRLTTDILHHPLPALIAHGIPTSISNDDPAILGQDAAGVSYDFYQVIQGFDNIGLAGLGALAHDSLRWSNFEDQSDQDWLRDIDLAESGGGIKAKHLRDWNQQWEKFCEWIVEEFRPESRDEL